jgi:hypothetical protein
MDWRRWVPPRDRDRLHHDSQGLVRAHWLRGAFRPNVAAASARLMPDEMCHDWAAAPAQSLSALLRRIRARRHGCKSGRPSDSTCRRFRRWRADSPIRRQVGSSGELLVTKESGLGGRGRQVSESIGLL